jgi:hypothetical protein
MPVRVNSTACPRFPCSLTLAAPFSESQHRSRWRRHGVPSSSSATSNFTAAAAVLLWALACLVTVTNATLACKPGVVHTYQFETTVEKSVVELGGDHNRLHGKVTVADVLQLVPEGLDAGSELHANLKQQQAGSADGDLDSEPGQGCLRVIEVHLTGSVGEGGDPTSQSLPLPPVAIFQRDTGVPFA